MAHISILEIFCCTIRTLKWRGGMKNIHKSKKQNPKQKQIHTKFMNQSDTHQRAFMSLGVSRAAPSAIAGGAILSCNVEITSPSSSSSSCLVTLSQEGKWCLILSKYGVDYGRRPLPPESQSVNALPLYCLYCTASLHEMFQQLTKQLYLKNASEKCVHPELARCKLNIQLRVNVQVIMAALCH